MPLTPILTHVADANGRLLAQYQGKARFSGLISGYAAAAQAIEYAAWGVLNGRLLANAVGAPLDNIGALAAAPTRGAMTDAQYRPVVAGTIFANNSDGTLASLNQVATTLFGASSAFIRTPNSYAGSTKHISGTLSLGVGSPAASPVYYGLLFGIFNKAVDAGIAVDSFYTYNASGVFACAGTEPYVKGFDDGTGTVGGGLANGVFNYTSL